MSELSRHHNPDDTMCRPCAFTTYDPQTQIVQKTFFIYNPWHLVSTKKIGELIVHETPHGFLLAITLE